MPSYQFHCHDCKDNSAQVMSITEYSLLKTGNISCIVCGSKKITRIFKSINSTVERSVEETVAEIKEDVKKTIEKINAGDISTIADIYGEEVNKLKTKDRL